MAMLFSGVRHHPACHLQLGCGSAVVHDVQRVWHATGLHVHLRAAVANQELPQWRPVVDSEHMYALHQVSLCQSSKVE